MAATLTKEQNLLLQHNLTYEVYEQFMSMFENDEVLPEDPRERNAYILQTMKEHEFWGEIIVGCVILDENIDETKLLKKLKDYSSKNLSTSYQPDKWIIVKEFPCTSTGKIKKNLLSKIMSEIIG